MFCKRWNKSIDSKGNKINPDTNRKVKKGSKLFIKLEKKCIGDIMSKSCVSSNKMKCAKPKVCSAYSQKCVMPNKSQKFHIIIGDRMIVGSEKAINKLKIILAIPSRKRGAVYKGSPSPKSYSQKKSSRGPYIQINSPLKKSLNPVVIKKIIDDARVKHKPMFKAVNLDGVDDNTINNIVEDIGKYIKSGKIKPDLYSGLTKSQIKDLAMLYFS